MSISAMKQALEALDSDDPSIQLRAAVALRQAIAEAEKQEPACWINGKELDDMRASAIHWGASEWRTNLGLLPVPGDVPLYTAPVHASDMSEKHVQISDKN
jgi:hypothetical protein